MAGLRLDQLLGLIFVVASVDVGVYLLFRDMIVAGIFGVDVSAWGNAQQITRWW